MQKKVILQEGDIVIPIKNIDIYGKPLNRYDETYIITKIENKKVDLSAKRGKLFYYWGTIDVKNIKKVEE